MRQAVRQAVPDDWPVPSEDAPMHVGFEYSAIVADEDDDDEHIVPEWQDPQEDDHFLN